MDYFTLQFFFVLLVGLILGGNHGMDVKGIILNHYSVGAIREDNERMIERLTGVPMLARVKDGDRELEVDLEELKRVYD